MAIKVGHRSAHYLFMGNCLPKLGLGPGVIYVDRTHLWADSQTARKVKILEKDKKKKLQI